MTKILIVDDEKDIKDLFLQRFRREIKNGQFSFSFAFSGEEALRYLAENMHEAILILSDINMPGMSGIELLKTIRATYKLPPIIVMMITAYNDKTNFEEAMKSGADDFLNKPLNFVALKEKLNAL